MRTIKLNVSYEKLISRVPGLFAFIEFDEQGKTKIVKATSGEQGNYGKIVADMYCPKFPNNDRGEGEYEVCEDGTLLKLSEGVHSYRTIIDLYYKAIKNGNADTLRRYTKESAEEENKKRERVGKPLVEEGEYVEEFLSFVEKGIGLKYVHLSEKETDKNVCGETVLEKFPLAPDYIYLGEAHTYYDRLIKLIKQIDFWKKHNQSCQEDKQQQKAIEEEYALMNGNELKTVLESLIIQSESVALSYLNYSILYEAIEAVKDTRYGEELTINVGSLVSKDIYDNLSEENKKKCKKIGEYGTRLNFGVNLVNTIKDLGMVTPHIQEWVAGKRYYIGDVVYRVDEYGYGMTWECKLNGKNVKEDDWGRKYTEGSYDEETELIYFDEDNWEAQSLNWVDRIGHVYTCKKCMKIYQTSEAPEKCECGSTEFSIDVLPIKGTCNSHLTQLRRYDEYINSGDQVETPDNLKDWLWYYRVGLIVNRENLYDEQGNIAVMYPMAKKLSEDVYVNGVQAITNDGNNIGNNIVWDGDTAINLAVWGDMITNIECVNNDDDTGIITFTYWIGAHLVADKDYLVDENGNETAKWYSVDDDGNYKYFFKNLRFDDRSPYGKNHGVKYVESYIYYKSDEEDSIWKLVEGGKFTDYIMGKFDKDSTYITNAADYRLREKYEFSTSNNLYQYEFRIGSRIKNVPYFRTNFTTMVDIKHVDVENTPLIRYYYYNGVNFHPTVNKDVYVERGVTQAFEKHIKFSEIKTFEDMENYSNGGFFVVSSESIDLG